MGRISDRLYRIILEKKYSYGDLAKMTGIPKSAIQRYATGQTTKIPVDRLDQLAAALGVSTEYILGWESLPEKQEEKPAGSEIRDRVLRAFDQMDPELQEIFAAQAEAALALRRSQDTH